MKLDFSIYTGTLNQKKMDKEPLRANRIWCSQKHRQGVEYSSREFIGWWLNNIKNFKGKKPNCSRKDHSKKYSFDNILMEEQTDNVKEMHQRVGLMPHVAKSRKRVFVFDKKTSALIAEFSSYNDCIKTLGIQRMSFFRKIKSKKNIDIGLNFYLKGE